MRPTRRFWTICFVTLLAIGLPRASWAETGVFTDAGDTAVDTFDAADTGDTGEVGDTSDGGDTGVGDTGDTGGADVGDTDVGDTGGVGDVDAGDTADGGDTDLPDVADGGDTSDTGVDAGDTEVADTGPDAGDTEVADTGPDAGDAGLDAGDTSMMVDGALDADAGPLARFFGRVDVEGLEDDGGVEIALTRTDGDGEWTQTTGSDGTFSFDELENGSYSVQLTKPEFVTISETFELNGDREERYTMFRDQAVDLKVEAVFADEASAPQAVRFNLEGPRGSIQPESPIAVEGTSATWTVESLGVGTWTIQAAAPGFRTTSFQFAVESFDGGMTQHDIRLLMVERDIEIPPPDQGCGCRSSGGGSPAQSITWIVFALLGVVTVRGRRRQ